MRPLELKAKELLPEHEPVIPEEDEDEFTDEEHAAFQFNTDLEQRISITDTKRAQVTKI